MNESSVERQDQEYISDSSASHASGVSVLAAIDRTVSMYSKDTKDYLEATGNTVSNSKRKAPNKWKNKKLDEKMMPKNFSRLHFVDNSD